MVNVIFSYKTVVNIYIVYEINLWPECWFYVTKFFFFFFGAVKLIKNSGFDKYKYSGYGTGFNSRRNFLLSDGSESGKNVIIFIGADISSSGHVDMEKKISWFLIRVQHKG